MRIHPLFLFVIAFYLFHPTAFGQVLDVDGDRKVGPQEMIVVAEEWEQDAQTPDDHDHLGQTWVGEGSPLKLRGSFEERIYPIPTDLSKAEIIPFPKRPSAPLILDSTSSGGYGLKVLSEGPGIQVSSEGPDLILAGDRGVIAATDDDYENLSILSNNNVYLYLDHNRDDPHTSGLYIIGRNGYSILELSEEGDMWLRGALTEANLSGKQEKISDSAPASAIAPLQTPNIVSGNVLLDEKGEAWVDLPEGFETENKDFRYSLTPVGSSAPNLFVADRVHDHGFRIAGGVAGMEVSWVVVGVSQ